MYNGYQAGPESGEPFVPSVSVDALPDKVDWREKGYVTEVKNQVGDWHLDYCGTYWNVNI